MFKATIGGREEWLRLKVTRRGYQARPDQTAVEVYDEFGAPYARLSVCLVDAPELPTPDHFWLKDWSENREIADALIAAGRIAIDSRIPPVQSGFVAVKAARLA